MSTTFTNTGNFTGNLTGTGTNSANTNTGMATGTGTGSWANSTHSVIWMSRSGKSPAMPNTNQPHAAQYASLTVAALLTIAAASNLIDVYGSALSWTSAAIPATIIGSLVALAGLVPAGDHVQTSVQQQGLFLQPPKGGGQLPDGQHSGTSRPSIRARPSLAASAAVLRASSSALS